MLLQIAGCPVSWLNNIPLCIYTTSFLSIHLLDGHLGCFHILAIENNDGSADIALRDLLLIITPNPFFSCFAFSESSFFTINRFH